MIQQRTSRHAEEEIRLVFAQVAEKLANATPNLYQDMRGEMVDGFMEFTFENHKA
jgi:thymidylate synthase ThyX